MKKSTILIIIISLVATLTLLLLGSFGTRDASNQSTTSLIMTGRAAEWTRGKESARAELVEYLDFQCPACQAYYPVIKQLMADFPDDLKVTYAYFPLTNIHQNALPSAYAAEAAGRQGKFWEMADLLFEKQTDWSQVSDPENLFSDYAAAIGLDTERFITDFSSPATKEEVEAQRQSALSMKLAGTPTFFLNGQRVENPRSYEEFKGLIEKALEK